MRADAIDAKGRLITLAADGGLWIGDDFYPRGSRGSARSDIALPLQGVPEMDATSAAENIALIMEALNE